MMTSDYYVYTWDSPKNSPKTNVICGCFLYEIVCYLFELLQINKPAPDPLEKFKTMDFNLTIQELEDFNPTKDFAKTVESNIVYVVGAALGKDYCIDGWNTRFCQCQLGENFKS